MKLKKVTALLLATSMVLTSVNVAPIFADEEITFAEENYTVEDDASADADFGDVVVEEDAVEEENTSADVAFDDVIEDDTVVEDVVTEEEAFVEETPEEFVGNEDVLEAIQDASEDAGYVNTITLDETNAYMTPSWKTSPYTQSYTGSEITVPVSAVTYNNQGTAFPIPVDYVKLTDNKETDANDDYWYTVSVDYTDGDAHYVGSWSENWVIEPVDVTADYELRVYEGHNDVTTTFTPIEYDGEEHNIPEDYELVLYDTNNNKTTTLALTVDEDSDYKATKVGNYTLTATLEGNQTGSWDLPWAITKKVINPATIKIALIDEDDDLAFVTEDGKTAYVKSNTTDDIKKFKDHFKMVYVEDEEEIDLPEGEWDFRNAAVMEVYVGRATNYWFGLRSLQGSNYDFDVPNDGTFTWNVVNFLPDATHVYNGKSFEGIESWDEIEWFKNADKTDKNDLVFTSYKKSTDTSAVVIDNEYLSANETLPNYFDTAEVGTHVWGYKVAGGPEQTVNVTIETLDVTIAPVFYADASYTEELEQPAEVGTTVYTDWVVEGDDETGTLKKFIQDNLIEATTPIAFDIKYGNKEITSSDGVFVIEEGDVDYTVTPIISTVTKNNVAEFDNAIVRSESDDVSVKRLDAEIQWYANGKETESPFTATYDGTEYTFTAESPLTEIDPKYTVKVTGDTTAKNVGTGTAVATIYYDGEEDTGWTVEKLDWEIKAAEVTPVWYYKEKNATTWTKAAEEVSAPYSADGYELKALLEGEDSAKESEIFKTTVDVAENVYTGTATTKTSDYTIKKGTETFVLKMAKQEDNSLVVGIKNAKIAYGSDPSAVTFEFAYYLEGKETTDENIVKWMEEHKGEITYAISDLYTKTTPVGTYADYMTAVVSKEIGRYTDPTTKKSYVVTGTTGDLTVGKASATSVMWDDIKTFTYDGQTHDFPKAVVYGLNGKVIKVKSYFKDAALTTPATEEKERGNYTVYIGELDDPNYDLSGIKASDLKCAWSINDDLSNLTAVYDSTQKYIKTPTNTALEYQFAVSVVNEGVIYTADRWQSEIPGAVNAGTYWTYYRTRKAGTNDAFGAPTYAVLKINKKPITATLKIDPIPVNGTLPTSATMADFEITGIEDVDSKAQFYMATGFTGDITDFWISKAGTESQVPYYSEITRTSGSYDVNFAKDYFGDKVDNKALILDKKGNYQVTLTKSTFTVGKVKVRIEWRIDDKKNNSKVEYDAAPHFALAYIISPSEYAGMVLEPMGDYARTEVGTYTATISATDLKRYEIVSGDTSYNWEITPKQIAVTTLMDKYNDGFGNNVIAYGTADPTSTLGRNDLVYYGIDEDGKINLSDPMTDYPYFDADDITGTPTFTTNYRQYNNVDYSGSLYHIDVDASALTAKNYTIVKALRAKLYVRPAKVTIVADNKNVGINATTMPKLTASFKDTVSGSGESAAAEHDFDAKVFTVEPTMDVYFPQTRGVYAIKVTPDDVTFTEPKRTYAELIAAGKPVNFEFQFTNGTYTVGEGDFEINLTDTRVAYDADPHTITGIPATLPNGIEIYYIDEEANGFVWASTAKGVFEENAKLASVNRVYKKTVGTHYVYWHIDGKDYGYDSYGVNKIVIIPNDQSKAEDLAKEIEEAVKTPLDNDKVKQARKDYDAADKAVQNHPAVGDAIKKLEAAEKAIADEAAKQIAALLPADPSKAVDTDRPNYEQAQGIYDALSDAEKALIPGSKTALDTAKAAIEADEAAKEKAFVDAVAALPAPADAKATDRAAVDAAKALYDGLTAAEKADPAVKEAKAKLDLVDAAVKAAEEAEDADKAAAKKVADMIEALPAPEDVTVADENAIKNAVDAFDALTEAQQALVPEADQEKLAADVLALAAAIVKEAEDQAAADDIEALIDAIAKSEPGDGKAAMEAAKAAYEAATDDVKAKVDNGHKEVLDNAIECYKKDTTFQAGRGVYRVLSNGDVTYVKPLYPEDTYFQVPNDVVCPEGFPFKVVKVSVNAFKGCTNVTKIWMGKNIVTIGKYAFKGATNLRTLIVRTQAIDVTEKIENAFAGMAANRNGKVNVQIWEKMLSKYEPMFRGAGKLPAKAYFTTID